MTPSIVGQVTTRGTALIVATLLLVGLGTGLALHVEARRGLDAALLAAAEGRAHPDPEEAWRTEHSRSRIEAWVVADGDVAASLLEEARRRERPVFADVGSDRLVLVTAESEGDDDDDGEQHLTIAARAPAITLARSVGPFAAAFTALSVLVAGVAAGVLRVTVIRALAAVSRARDEASSVLGLGQGKRLSTDGPDEMRDLLVAFNALLDRLDAAHQAQGRFTAEAAHELRTPVTALLGELEVALRRDRSPEEYRATLASARDEVERLRRVVEGLLALARLDAGEVDRHRELVRAREIAADAVSGERASLDGVSVRVEASDDPELDVHRGLATTALGNLLRNAARHAPGTEVVLRVHRDGAMVVFDVDDAGPGVDVVDQEALFDRFARAGEARRRDPAGLGLGLPIARQIARRHGGDCTLSRSPAGGTRARLTLRLPVG